MLQDGLLVLVAPDFQTRTECLSKMFLRVCEEERWHVLHKFIEELPFAL